MVYVLLANGFEECEAVAPIDIIRRANKDLFTVSINNDKNVTGSHGITVTADIFVEEINKADVEMLVFPGGGEGYKNLSSSPEVLGILAYCAENLIKIGAICASPAILARQGYLKGKKATSYPAFRNILTEYGAELSDLPVVTDGIFTTARSMNYSVEFGLRLAAELCGEETASNIKNVI